MSFAVAAEAYDRFMGRYSAPLAPRFLEFARVESGPVLDVGCGPGALTTVLVERFGTHAVAAADPSEPFVSAARKRHPGARIEVAPAEEMPFGDRQFAAALAQLVVHFMADPLTGIREMKRVTRECGVVAACVWDFAGGRGPLGVFWNAARQLDPEVDDESGRAGAREGHLTELLDAAGLRDVEGGAVSIAVEHSSFDEWWEPFTFGVGPAGAYVAALSEDGCAVLRDRCRELLPAAPFTVHARAWAARGVV